MSEVKYRGAGPLSEVQGDLERQGSEDRVLRVASDLLLGAKDSRGPVRLHLIQLALAELGKEFPEVRK